METTALVLAPDDLGLLPIFGVPAIRRTVLILRRLKVDKIHVFGRSEDLRPLLGDLLPGDAFRSTLERDALEAVSARLHLPDKGRVLALKANLVLDRFGLARFLEATEASGISAYVSEEGAKSCQMLLGDRADILPLLPSLWEGRPAADLPVGARKLTGVAGLPHRLTEGSGQERQAEGKLVASLAFQSPDDGFLARHVDRRISRFISGWLARRRVSPNWITLGGVAIGSSGAFLLSRPGYGSHLAGALLFLLCVIVDGVDGEVARLKLMESVFGHYLDVTTDNLVHFAVFVGIAFGLFRASGDPMYLHALGWMLGGFLLCLIAVYQCILRRTPEALAQSPRLVRLLALLSNRDFAYLVLILALIDRLGWFLLGAAAGTYLFAAILWGLSLYESRAAISSEAS